MKKIVISDRVKSLLAAEENFLSRTDVTLFTATSNDEALNIHRAEKADLIITQLDAPGMAAEALCSAIRQYKDLRNVSVIMVCADTEPDRARCEKCGANEVLTFPMQTSLLLEKTRQLLNVPPRGSYRVLLNVSVEGRGKDASFLCRSENISEAGLLIETDRHLAKGDRVSCSFLLPGSIEVRAAGEVVRTVKPPLDSNLSRYGIRFSEISDHARAAIRALASRK